MRTQFLYPLIYPFEMNDKYLYLAAIKSNNKKHVRDLLKKYHIFIDIEVQMTRNETFTMYLQVFRELDSNITYPKIKYKVMYLSKSEGGRNPTNIRADNFHPYPHIDLELPDMPKETKMFDTDPSDYEASVNTVLRYAEYYKNKMTGVDFWLHNLTIFRKELYIAFKSAQSIIDITTSFTDVARLVSLDILTKKGEVIYDFSDLTKLVTSKFMYCLNYEHINHRPLKISKNLIQQDINMNLFPFPIILKSEDGPLKPRVFDIRGNELPSDSVHLLGKTTYENSGAR